VGTGLLTRQTPLADLRSDARCDWRRLAESLGANPSLYPGWTELTAKSHGIASESYFVTVYNANKLSAVYPLMVSYRQTLGFSYRSLELITNRACYHNQTISVLDPETEVEYLLEEAERRNADVLHLAGILDSSAIGEYLKQTTRHRQFHMLTVPGVSSPYLPLSMNWNKLLNLKPKKFRYKVRQRANAVSNTPDLRLQWYSDANDCRQMLEAIRTIEEHSWKKDAGIAVFGRPTELRYHELLLPFLASKNALFGNVLVKEDAPIAYSLCCISNGWAGQLKTSFDSRFSDISPGGIVIDNAVQCAIEHGASEFDFLGDADPHKLAWTKESRAHTSYFLYLKSTFRGRVIGKLKEIRARHSSNRAVV